MNTPSTTELTLPIEGMTCAPCVNRIERFLRKTPGVESATVNLATEMATNLHRSDLAVQPEAIRALRRRISDEVFRRMRHDEAAQAASPSGLAAAA